MTFLRRLIIALASLVLLAPATGAIAQTDTTEPDLATGIGVAPGFFAVDEALRGNSYTDTLILTNNLPGDRRFTLQPTEDVAPWITFLDPTGETVTEIVVPHRGSVALDVVITVPADAANGSYEGRVEVAGVPVDATDAASAAELSIGAVVPFTIEVGGEMRRAGTFDFVRVQGAEVGQPVRIAAAFNNTGNVGYSPSLEATITRAGQPVEVVAVPAEESIDAGRAEEIEIVWDSTDALPGDYSVTVTATAEGYEFAPVSQAFRLEPAGTVERSGALESFAVVNAPQVGGIARVRGEFRNLSSVAVTAILVAEVQRDGQLVDEVRSLELVAAPDNVTDVDVVVDDLQPGSYEVSGKVNFDGLETETLTASFTVEEAAAAAAAPGGGSGGSTLTVVLGLVAAAIAAGIGIVAMSRRKRQPRPERAEVVT